MKAPDLGRFGLFGYGFAIILSAALACSPALADEGVIKIGVLTDLSGPYAGISGAGAITAVQMAVEDFGGDALGMPIEVVSADHKNNADAGAAIARQWFDRDGVDMITDLTSSQVALAVQAIAKDRGKIDIVAGAASGRLTGVACSPTGFHWTYDSHAVGRVVGGGVVEEGDKTWFFITTEGSFGPALQQNATNFITAAGGKVLGSVHHPLGTTDFSPYLLQAQASGAQVVVLADAGADAVNLIRQAAEFGIGRGGQRIAALLITLTDVHELGLELAQGIVMTTASYWDQSPESRAWSKRFLARTKHMPNMVQAGDYSATIAYLKAIEAAGTKDGVAVAQKIHELPVNDAFFKDGAVRPDGLMQHDMYLAVVKSPSDSKGRWDYLDILDTIPGDEAFLPLQKSVCPLIKK
jgi:branched-chain amino acid transport system substrate-binding protein